MKNFHLNSGLIDYKFFFLSRYKKKQVLIIKEIKTDY